MTRESSGKKNLKNKEVSTYYDYDSARAGSQMRSLSQNTYIKNDYSMCSRELLYF